MSDNLGGAYNPKKQALAAKSEELFVKRNWVNKKKLCWKCQKEKSMVGGFIRAAPGFFKFVCKECCDAKKAKDESSNRD